MFQNYEMLAATAYLLEKRVAFPYFPKDCFFNGCKVPHFFAWNLECGVLEHRVGSFHPIPKSIK